MTGYTVYDNVVVHSVLYMNTIT